MGLIELTAIMKAPIVLTDDLHLDGLLSEATPAGRHVPFDKTLPLSAIPEINLPVPRISIRGHRIYASSAAQISPDAKMTVVEVVKRRNAEDLEALRQPIHLGLGPGKNQMTKYPSIVTPWIRWYCIGERQNLLKLCRRIFFIGASRSMGNGAIQSWEAAYIDDDAARVFVHKGIAQRNLPIDVCSSVEETRSVQLEYPYWHPGRSVEGSVSVGTRCELHDEIVARLRRFADSEIHIAKRRAIGQARRQRREASLADQ